VDARPSDIEPVDATSIAEHPEGIYEVDTMRDEVGLSSRPTRTLHRIYGVSGSTRGRDRKPKGRCGFGQAAIIGHDGAKNRSDQLRGRKMNRIERAQPDRLEHACRVEQRIVEPDQIDAAQETACSFDGHRPARPNRTQDLRARQTTRDAGGLPPQVRAQGP
jgi:hypothetical protein